MESLFAWASAQMDTLAVTMGDVKLSDIVAETVQVATQAASDRGIALREAVDDQHVHANRDMLAKVLRNLVSNAIKFTLPSGSVTIAAQHQEGVVTISVADTGLGMARGKIDDLFKLDRRTTTNGTAGERGSGLGLLLCRDLLERQGSELTVQSVVGQGTTFQFALVQRVAMEAEAAVG